MKTRIALRSIVVLVLSLVEIVIIALSASFLAMLDQVVHGDLYRYGLQFDYRWAVQYWTYSDLMMSLFAVAMVVTGVSMVPILVHKGTNENDSAKFESRLLLVIGILMISFSMFFFNRLDYIVYSDLYRYGLKFSYEWAGKYWIYTRSMLGLLGVAVATGIFSIALISKSAQPILRVGSHGKILFSKTSDSVPPTLPRDFSAGPLKEIVGSEAELEELRRKVWSYGRLPTRLAGYVVTVVGAAVLLGSMVFSSTVWAIVGLVLTFWGVLFFFLKPTSLVKADLLDSSSFSFLENVYRLISEFGLKGKGVYLPPRSLKELRSGLVYISAREELYVPTRNEAGEAEDRIFLKNPGGVCLVPSGVALVNLFEKELGTSFAGVGLEYLVRNLPKVFIEALEIAEDFDINVESGRVHVRIEGSIYKDLCDDVRKLSMVCEIFGCPLCSSIACGLTRASGKPVVMDGNEVSQNGNVMDVYYRVLEE